MCWRILGFNHAFVFVLLCCCLIMGLCSQGFTLVLVQHKEKDFLVAFGGIKKEPSNQVGL